MRLVRHPLEHTAPGTHRELVSLHYGPTGGAKALIQAGLHADEVPALLVAHHLRGRLEALEAEGRLRGEIVLLPYANPIGLDQRLLLHPIGRFDLASGENFNRHYADLVPRVAARVAEALSGDAVADVAAVRAALHDACAELPADDELQTLRRKLLGLAIDADVVLDLHSDNEAVLHLYTATPLWPEVESLASLLGVELSLVATTSGDEPFDEACSTVWPRLATEVSRRLGREVRLPGACIAATIELRGETDVDHALAARDAEAILAWLVVRGLVDGPAPSLPPVGPPPWPLTGCMPVIAPSAGIVAWRRPVGVIVAAGEPLADLVDPSTGETRVLTSPTDGLFFARELRRYATAGAKLAKVAGRAERRTG
ncbi:MAG: succinylglutamate desuccinylase/aspartoacylase family protein [Pseudomonadota bacterium]